MNSSYNFTERVRSCLALAREESHALNHEYVGTEHILLGVIRGGEGVAMATLNILKIDPEKVRQDLLDTVKRGKPGEMHGPDLPYTSRAKKVLELSMMEARDLNHSYVGTEHVLLGLLREEKGIAAQVLRHNGLDIDKARMEILRFLASADHTSRPVSGKEVESVTIKVRFADGSFQQDVFKDVPAAIRHLKG